MARKQKAQAQNTAESTSTPALEVKVELQDTPIKPVAGDSTLHFNDSQAKTQPKRKAKARKAKRGVPNALMESDPNLPRANEGTSVPALKLIKEEYAECLGSLSSPITIDSTPPPAQQQHPNADSVSSPSSSRPLQNSRAHDILLQKAGLDREHAANSQPDTRQTSIANVQLTLPSITTLLGSLLSEFNLHMYRQNQHMNNQLVENQHPNWGTDSMNSRGPGMSLLLEQPPQTDWSLGTGHPNPAYNDSCQLFPCQQSVHPLPRGQFAPAPSQLHSSSAPPSPAPPWSRRPQFDNSSTQEKHGVEDILDAKRAPLKHLPVIHDILSAYHRSTNMPFELLSGEGKVTPIGHLVVDRLTDEALADKDPFQASMGLVFLSRLGLKF